MNLHGINCDRPDSQPMRFGEESPPVVPNIPLHPLIAPFIVRLSASVANRVSQMVAGLDGIAPNPGRIFVYNSASQNGYNNQFFGYLVSSAADYLLYNIVRKGAHAENAIPKSAQEAVSVEVARAINSQQLIGSVDNRVQQEARNILNSADVLSHEIANIKNQPIPNNVNQGQPMNYPQYQPQYQPQPVQNNQPMVMVVDNQGRSILIPASQVMGGSQPVYQNAPPMQPMHVVSQPQTLHSGGNPMFGGGHPPPRQNTNTGGVGNNNGRYSHLEQKSPQVADVVNKVKDEGPKIWCGSNLQAYPPAFKANTEVPSIVVRVDPITGRECTVIELTEIEVPMDRAKHALTTPYNLAVERGSTDANVETHVKNNLQEAIKTSEKALERHTKIENRRNPDEKVMLTTNIDEAVMMARLYLFKEFSGNVLFKAYTTYQILNRPFIYKVGYRRVIEAITKANKFQDLIAIISSITPLDSNDYQTGLFVQELETFMLNEMNNVLKTRFAITGLELENFTADLPTLINYLRQKRGDIYSTSMEAYQERFIRELIYSQVIDEENDKNITEMMFDETIGKEAIVTNIPQNITVTAVGVNSSELNLGLLNGCGNIITSEKFPALATFTQNLIRNVYKTDVTFAHHYISTLDGKVYELSEGAIGNLTPTLITQIR